MPSLRPSGDAKLRRSLRGLVLAPLLLGAAGPQAPPPPGTTPAFRAEADYVEVDAFVTDERGEFASGLTSDDFQVFEEGHRETIAVFAEVSVPVDRVEAGAGRRADPPRDAATNDEALRGRVYVLVLDELHTDARRTGEVRKLARAFIERHMAQNDLAAVVSTGGRADAMFSFSRQKERLLEAVDRFAGRKTRSATLERLDAIERQRDLLRSHRDPGDPASRQERALAPRPGLERDPFDLQRVHDARASMETLARAARAFGALDGRRKAILWFGEGVDYDTLDVMGRAQREGSAVLASVRQAITTATRHGVAVYAVDPRGPLGPSGPDDILATAPAAGAAFGIDSQSLAREARLSQDSLRTLAEQTGGIAFLDTSDFAPAFDRIVRASSRYYLLGYYPSDPRRDGAFRRLEVRVARRGLSVVARRGYVRPGPEAERRPTPRIAAAEGTSPELRELLASPWPQPGLPLVVTAAPFREGREASVAVAIELPSRAGPVGPEAGAAAGETEVSFVVIDREGTVRAGERLLARHGSGPPPREPRPGLSFVRTVRLSPGPYQLRVAARQGSDGPTGSVAYDFEAPDYADRKLAVSGILLASRRSAMLATPAVDAAAQEKLGATTAARRFDAEDVVTAFAEIYDALEPAHEVGVTTRVAASDGRQVFLDTRLRTAERLANAGSGFRHEVEIPLAGFPAGRYVLEIEATPTLGEPTASRALEFEVVPAGVGAGAPASPRAADLPAGPGPLARVDRLESWLAAIERHEPGAEDAATLLVRSWTPEMLLELAADVALVHALVADPGYPVMWLVDPERPGRPKRAPYSAGDEARIRALAAEAAKACGADTPCARNRLLKRGALLHTDALLHAHEEARAGPARGGERFRMRFADGRPEGTAETTGHLELARSLLDNVHPDPARDETVRLWYTALAAHGQHHERHTRQEDRGVQLFPDDPDLLLLAGAFHELLASPRMQGLARAARLPGGASHGIRDERSELREAEKLLRRALASRPAFAEARIRLGRVLHRLGRAEPAVRELEQAVLVLSSEAGKADADAGLLLYYAEMFLGAAREALGRFDAAEASYARAAALYPRASSARFAQSQLALRGQDRGGALAAVEAALRPSPAADGGRDPWWRYHVVQGRGADAWLARLYRSATAEP